MDRSTTVKKTDNKTVQNAKRLFLVSLFDLSWKLLGAMLVPIFIGMFLDSILGSGKVLAQAGFVIGVISGFFVMRSVVRKLSVKDDIND